jgi:hypothetical protein
MIQPLILLREAPKDGAPPGDEEDLGLEVDPTHATDPPDPDTFDPGANLAEGEADDPIPPEDDEAATPEDGETPPENEGDDLEDDEDDDGLGGDEGAGEQPDPVAEQLKRERLYDSVSDAQLQAKNLSDAATFIINRSQDPTALKFASRAKQLVDEVDEQCAIVMSKFADLGYERARDLYATIRERVSAVAEIIKHVIDGDDDFRKSDSGNPQRNGSAPGNGRGRSE